MTRGAPDSRWHRADSECRWVHCWRWDNYHAASSVAAAGVRGIDGRRIRGLPNVAVDDWSSRERSAAPIFLFGLGLGAISRCVTALGMGQISRERMGFASSLFSLIINAGTAAGGRDQPADLRAPAAPGATFGCACRTQHPDLQSECTGFSYTHTMTSIASRRCCCYFWRLWLSCRSVRHRIQSPR